MKVTNETVIRLHKGMQQLGNLMGVKFIYAAAKNESMLERLVKALEKGMDMTEDYRKYEKKRVVLCEEHAELDENKQPRMNPINPLNPTMSSYVFKNPKKFQSALDKLKKQHKEAVKEREDQMEQWTDLLQDEVEIDLHLVNVEDVPEKITKGQMSGVFEMIRDPK